MDSQQATYHTPVMLEESMRGLDIKPQGIYVDATFGGGGHSKELLSRLGDGGRLFAFDQDSDARGNLPSDPRLTFVQSNFRYLSNWMCYYGVEHIDGLLADLGAVRPPPPSPGGRKPEGRQPPKRHELVEDVRRGIQGKHRRPPAA